MDSIVLTFKYRLMPTRAQHRTLEAILESQRQLYNAALEERIGAYKKAGVSRSYFDQTKALTEWRQSDGEARAVPASLQRTTLKRVDNAYKAFFRRMRSGEKPGFPRFRGMGRFTSFGFSQFGAKVGVTLTEARLHFGGMPGRLRIRFHRPLPLDGSIIGCSFKKRESVWSVSFAVRLPTAATRIGNRAVGVDVGINTFAVLSNGSSIPSLRAGRLAERELTLAHRSFARKRRGSRGWIKARRQLRRAHDAVARRRANQGHRASASLIRDFDLIACEDLSIASLMAGAPISKHIQDAGWGQFIKMLRYKAERAGAQVVLVDPRWTSQACSGCGAIVRKSLGDRLHSCPKCGLQLDRDVNAACNILSRAGVGPGLHNVAGCGKRAGGNISRDP